MCVKDILQLVAIEEEAFKYNDPMQAQDFVDLLNKKTMVNLICCHEKQEEVVIVLGYISFSVNMSEHHAVLQSMATRRDFRGQGIGKLLLAQMIRSITEGINGNGDINGSVGEGISGGIGNGSNAAIQYIVLEVGKENRAAQELYKSFGFKVTGELPAYFDKENGAKEDAFEMMLKLWDKKF